MQLLALCWVRNAKLKLKQVKVDVASGEQGSCDGLCYRWQSILGGRLIIERRDRSGRYNLIS